tara:strand:+ start:15182 stop:15451 length:270 start_codon:yes stop_codon:yes gene_type:complete
MKKLLILLLSITAAFASFDGWYMGGEGRYEYHIYSSSLNLDKNLTLSSKSKSHLKFTPAIFRPNSTERVILAIESCADHYTGNFPITFS